MVAAALEVAAGVGPRVERGLEQARLVLCASTLRTKGTKKELAIGGALFVQVAL